MFSKDLLCFVVTVLFCVWCSDAASDRSGCAAVREFFNSRNITDLQQELSGDAVGPSCGGACCSARSEVVLRARVRHDLRALAAHGGHALRGLLDNTAQTLHRHVLDLSTQFENKTRHLLAQVYRRMAVHADVPVDIFYTSILTYIDTTRYPDLGSQPPVDIERITNDFFTNLFPLAYHGAINLQNKDFSQDYKSCLRQSMDEVQPFGDIPRQIGRTLLKSLRATRVLIQALSLGSDVLNVTDGLLTEDASSTTQEACHAALLKMSYCPRCRGLSPSIKPCAGYCLNVVRGCLSRGSAELDLPWSSFVGALERLVTVSRSYETGLSAEAAMRNLDTRVSEAIMYSMENGKELENKVKRICGQPALVESDHGRDTPPMKGAARAAAPPPPDTQMLHFLASVAKSRGFYVNLADTICQDEVFAEQNDRAECWNGERVGEYTKTIAGSGASSQKYNPEVAVLESVVDPRVAQLADQLRRATQLLNTQSASVISSESYSFMQGDEAGGEGSGSGRDDFDSEEDPYDDDGSGSGDGGIDEQDHIVRTEVIVPPPIQTTNEKAGSTASSVHQSWMSAICQLIILDLVRRTLL